MATGGVSADTDSRDTCSVCLEPYRGRQPKLLPCYHTFCLLCLNQLTCKVQGQAQATVTCPTCRAVHVLPPAGASSLQTNFYVDDTDPTADPVGQPGTQRDGRPSDDLQTKVREQLQVMETVMGQLSKKEDEIERQKKAVELDIRHQYEAGLQVLDECRDQCLNSVEEVTQQLKDKLQVDTLSADGLLKPLQDLAGEGGNKGQITGPSTGSHPALLSDAVLRHFRQLSARSQQPPPALFSYNYSDNMTNLTNSLRHFMGAVLASGGADQGVNAGESVGDKSPQFAAGDSELWRKQQQQLRTMQTLMHEMQTENEHMKTELAALKQNMTAASTNIGRLQQDMTAVSTDVGSLQQDVTATSTNIGRLQQDMTAVSTDVGSLQKDVTAVQKDASRQQQSYKQVDTVITNLQSQMDKIRTPVFFSVLSSNDIVAIQDEVLKLNNVLSNDGGGYDEKTGIFTAPAAGAYLFLATARSDYDFENCLKSSRTFARFSIIADGVKVGSSWGKGLLSCTAHGVVRVKAGCQVCMKTELFEKQKFRGDGFTSFCGVLLYPE